MNTTASAAALNNISEQMQIKLFIKQKEHNMKPK